jgi:predicted phage tail protein
MTSRHDERSLGELFAELSRETGLLVRKEVELATTEMSSKARIAATHSAVVAAGGALAHAGLLVFLAAIVIGLAGLGMPAWLAALIVAVLTAAIGAVMMRAGITRLQRTSVAPTQTIETLKETSTWTSRTPA